MFFFLKLQGCVAFVGDRYQKASFISSFHALKRIHPKNHTEAVSSSKESHLLPSAGISSSKETPIIIYIYMYIYIYQRNFGVKLLLLWALGFQTVNKPGGGSP